MSAVGAIAVTCTTPVNAGVPVAGSSRWWAGRPPPSSQLRRPMPLVATPPSQQAERVQRAPVERALDLDGARAPSRAADREVARAVDREAGVAASMRAEHVGEQALDEAAAVEAQARARVIVPARDRRRSAASPGRRAGRAAGGGASSSARASGSAGAQVAT